VVCCGRGPLPARRRRRRRSGGRPGLPPSSLIGMTGLIGFRHREAGLSRKPMQFVIHSAADRWRQAGKQLTGIYPTSLGRRAQCHHLKIPAAGNGTAKTQQRSTMDMRNLLTGVAIIAALAIVTPASAQRIGPGPSAGTGTGPSVYPPGGFGPSSPMYDAQDVYPNPSAPSDVPWVPWVITWPTTTQSAGAVPPAVSPQSQ
jgi:hypothetical protein